MQLNWLTSEIHIWKITQIIITPTKAHTHCLIFQIVFLYEMKLKIAPNKDR